MKTAHLLLAAPLVFVALGLAQAQFAIPWSKVAGGGGTSTNGKFTLSGTIGQQDAGGPMTNSTYSLSGGFWVLPGLVTMPGAPTLHIAPAGPGQAIVFWTPATPGWVLQQAPEVTGSWTNAPSGALNPVTVSAVFPRTFYRLF